MAFHSEMIPVIAIVMGIAGLALPTTVFGVAKKWAEGQPDLAGPALGGAVAISLISILSGALIILVCLGWLPSPRDFM